mgnify:CR=1 FL=1
MRYKVEPSAERPGWWVATDTESLIVVRWQEHRFNDTQQVTMVDESDVEPLTIARLMREIGDYLAINHRNKLF